MNDTMLKLRIWARSEVTLGKIHLRRMGQQTALLAIAVGLALLTVGMFNLGLYELLAETQGKSKAAFLLAAANGLLAVVLVLAAQRNRPRPEEEMVQEIREMAMNELAADADHVKQELALLQGHVQRIENGLSTLTHSGLGGGLSMITSVGPVLDLIVETLKHRRDK